MQKEKDSTQDIAKDEPYRVRLPGFISEDEVGLGDIVGRITCAARMRPCG